MNLSKLIIKTLTEYLIELSKDSRALICDYPVEQPSTAVEAEAICFALKVPKLDKLMLVNMERLYLSDKTRPVTILFRFETSKMKYIFHKQDEMVLSNFANLNHKGVLIDDGKVIEAENINIATLRRILSLVTDQNTEIVHENKSGKDISADEFKSYGQPLISAVTNTYYI